jgi:hypothetical protein
MQHLKLNWYITSILIENLNLQPEADTFNSRINYFEPHLVSKTPQV